MRNVCKKVPSRLTCLFRRFCWKYSACSPLPATTTQLIFQSLSSHILCCCLNFFLPLTTSAISGEGKSNKLAPTRFAAGTICLRKNGIGVLPITCAMCTESPSTLSTNTSKAWNLYLSRSNHLVTSFRLEKSVEGLSEHQNEPSDTDRNKGFSFTACVSSQCE